ncbi:DUF3558 family protein [Nocardia lasii]|uniref:DUF3558 family protein n=1 Tax=Nocardia lasii TaxID=1616107 RepID=A0ABW1JNL3_9NOCA
MRRAFMAMVAGGAVAASLVACSETERAATVLFEPCAGVGAAALVAAGVDPATKVQAGAADAGWQTCEWAGKGAHLRIYSTSRTLDEFETESGQAAFTDFPVAGRTGRRLQNAAPASCDVLFPAAQGALRMVVVHDPGNPSQDACTTLRTMADSIVPTFPT